MSSVNCDIVILPEPEITAKAIRTSQELAPLGTEFTLGPESPVPHVSLYMVRLKTEDLPETEKRLAEIAAKTQKPPLEADGYNQDAGYIDANYKRTDALAQLQTDVIESINPLRDGLRPSDAGRAEKATGILRENYEKYGDRAVGGLFRPHVTFTRFTHLQTIPLEDMGAPTAFSGKGVKLAIFEMGKNGTCFRKIKAFDLQ